ncbi:MAG: hypothetical protein NTX29_03565 [Actinobacteria bacterium]|nr:hypothetical protein [Actinomycetota bacterium]
MIDVLLLVAFVVLPVLAWWVSGSLAWLAIRLAFGFGIAGNAVQSSIAFGWGWNLQRLQILVVVVLAVVLALAFTRRGSRRDSLRRQVLLIGLPMLLLGVFLVAMRLFATDYAGPLTGVGYFVNHPLAEDNAKWLHLSSQLASGNDLVFNGYAGGPLILVMVLMATLISVLSSLMLGGVNEVAVAVNTVIGTQFLLIALIPAAFAPFAERPVPPRPRTGGVDARWVPAPVLWAGMLVVFVASAVVTSYGHLSLQFVLVVLVLWATVFLVGSHAPRSALLATLAVVTTASVWLPLNVLGVALLGVLLVGAVLRRSWLSLGIVVVTALAAWDALFSSILYLLGINLGEAAGGLPSDSLGGAAGSAISSQLATADAIFQSPGGTEITEPLLAALALVSLLGSVWWYSRSRRVVGWRSAVPFAPIAIMAAYLMAVTIGDAIVTGGSPHYGVHKLAFAVTIMVAGATLPVAITALEGRVSGMTMLRWFAVGAVVVLLSLDTILPRGLSALSPKLWPGVDPAHPSYWSAAEVHDTGDQPIDSLPIACLFAPPTTEQPTGLPQGQQSYNCTRLLIGLNGLEGRAGLLTDWLLADWMGNEPHWDTVAPVLVGDTSGLTGRMVILGKPDGTVGGLATLNDLIARYPVSAG